MSALADRAKRKGPASGRTRHELGHHHPRSAPSTRFVERHNEADDNTDGNDRLAKYVSPLSLAQHGSFGHRLGATRYMYGAVEVDYLDGGTDKEN